MQSRTSHAYASILQYNATHFILPPENWVFHSGTVQWHFLGRAGHFRYFFFFNNKKLFVCIFDKVMNPFLHQSYLKSRLPVKLTWWKSQKVIFYYWKKSKIPHVPSCVILGHEATFLPVIRGDVQGREAGLSAEVPEADALLRELGHHGGVSVPDEHTQSWALAVFFVFFSPNEKWYFCFFWKLTWLGVGNRGFEIGLAKK